MEFYNMNMTNASENSVVVDGNQGELISNENPHFDNNVVIATDVANNLSKLITKQIMFFSVFILWQNKIRFQSMETSNSLGDETSKFLKPQP